MTDRLALLEDSLRVSGFTEGDAVSVDHHGSQKEYVFSLRYYDMARKICGDAFKIPKNTNVDSGKIFKKEVAKGVWVCVFLFTRKHFLSFALPFHWKVPCVGAVRFQFSEKGVLKKSFFGEASLKEFWEGKPRADFLAQIVPTLGGGGERPLVDIKSRKVLWECSR